MRILIIGNGPAAVAAIEAIRQRDTESAITVVGAERVRPYTPCFLGKYVSGQIGLEELALRPDSFYDDNDVTLISGKSAVRVLPDLHEVMLDDGERVGYDRLLIAWGAGPVKPDLPGIDGPGVVGFQNLTDAAKIRAQLGKTKHAVVLGSGFIALEAAESLTDAGVEVSVVVRTGQILRRLFDSQVSEMVERHMEAHGVRFLKQRQVAQVERADDGGLVAVTLENGERVPCELLVVAVGMTPKVDMAREAGIAVDRGILTDASMRTNLPDVWAAGDVAEPEIGGVRKTNLIHPNAVLTGRIAGMSMTGAERTMSNHFSDMNVLTVFGRSFLSVGEIGTDGTLIRNAESDGLLKVFTDKGVVRGVQIVGNVTRGGLYAALLGRRLPEGVGARLLAPDFNFGDIETWPFVD